MIATLNHLSLAGQLRLLFALLTGGALAVLAYVTLEGSRQADLARARTVADMIDSYRRHVTAGNGHYLRRDSAQDPAAVGRSSGSHEIMGTGPDGNSVAYTLYHKAPFTAVVDYARALTTTGQVAVRIVSDQPLNPDNAADAFELEALQALRAGAAEDIWILDRSRLRYARALRADANCQACHGQQASGAATAASYAPGRVVGLTSVDVEHAGIGGIVARQEAGFWVAVAVLAGALVLTWFQVRRVLVLPLRRGVRYAGALAAGGDLRKVRVPICADSPSSNNELHRLIQHLRVLHESAQSALAHAERTDMGGSEAAGTPDREHWHQAKAEALEFGGPVI